jgi:4,5-DOPA dioxygenase extradiol
MADGARYASLFVSHGAPTLPISDIPARDFLRQLGGTLPRPRAIVALSPHWVTAGVQVKSPARYSTWHDFGGFPEELYQIQYVPQGEPAVAARVLELLQGAGIDARASSDMRLDHGVWVPLLLAWPDADIPVVQVSSTVNTPRAYFELGRALRPLAGEGVLVLGSGGAVHNLGALNWSGDGPAPAWAREFDDWIDARVQAGDWDTLCNYRKQAPHSVRAHPTEDHFLPLFFAGGAGGVARPLHRSFSYGSLGMGAYGFA